ncbi:MAG: endonuclease/exonuclease/phosphatase family protein [Lentisphaeria bacterium]|nr:endonuclease/exonuclease/phosphatase family protein [Lentisphaeria bacterium]
MKFLFGSKTNRLSAVLMIAACAALCLVAALDLSGAQVSKADAAAEKNLIRVATYNVRGPNDRSPNSWRDRLPRMVRTIRENKFEVIGTQETLSGPIKDLKEALKFDYFGVGRDKRKGDEHNVIFYDPERFQVISQETFWLSGDPTVPGSIAWDSSLPRICTWGLLQDRRTGKRFVIANTHLDHQSAMARVQGINLVLTRLAPMIEQYPFILTGDFNSTADDMPVRRVLGVLRDARTVSETDHYGAGDETFHDFHVNRRERSHRKPIDFIFVNDRVRVLSHGTINDFRNGLASSDHFPVTAEIVLLDAPAQ